MSSTQPVEENTSTTRSPWWRRRWVQVVAAGLVGLAVGVGGSGSAAKDGTISDLRSQLAGSQARVTAAQGDLDRARTDAATRQDDLVTAQGQARMAEDSAKRATAKAQQEAANQYRSRLAAVAARERAVTARENKVTAAERGLNAVAFAGDGTYLVGHDVQPGLYRAAATPGCYWARLHDLNGTIYSIADNGNTDGQVTIQIQASDRAVEVSGCGDFTRIG